MQIYHGLDDVPADLGTTAVTIGNFDGVHLGHQHVLEQVIDQAKRRSARTVAVTFDPHPAFIHRPEATPDLLTGTSEKLTRLRAAGLDAALVLQYTPELAAHSAEDFIRTFFVQALNPAVVVVGYDVRFGRDNAGDLSTMIDLGKECGFAVEVMEDTSAESETQDSEPELGRRWSSTWVRDLLVAGEVAAAAAILGRPHRMRGVIVHGDSRGRGLGFPTANLDADSSGLVPADGVYAGWLLRTSRPQHRGVYPAAISVGTNPTFDGESRRVEAYVLDRDDLNLYDEEVVFEFVERLRPTLRFQSADELMAQMHADVASARTILLPSSP